MAKKYWSHAVMQRPATLDLEPGVFKNPTPSAVAKSLKRSADQSKRRKGTAFQSAMSMLNFYINRGGKNLTKAQKAKLERAKDELRRLYDRPARKKTSRRKPLVTSPVRRRRQ